IATSSPRRTVSVTPRIANVAPPSNDFDTPSSATTTGALTAPPGTPSTGACQPANGRSAGRRDATTLDVAWNVLSARAPRRFACASYAHCSGPTHDGPDTELRPSALRRRHHPDRGSREPRRAAGRTSVGARGNDPGLEHRVHRRLRRRHCGRS